MSKNKFHFCFVLVISFFLLAVHSCTPTNIKDMSTDVSSDSSSLSIDSVIHNIDSLAFADIPEQVTDEFHEFSLLDLKKYLLTNYNYDSLKWSFSQGKNLNIFLDEEKRILALRFRADWCGTENISLKVCGTNQDSAQINIAFTVNSLPTLSDIPDQTIGRKMKFDKIKLESYLKDKNNLPSQMRWEVSGAEKVNISIDNKNQAHVEAKESNWIGSDSVIFKVYDPYGAFAGDAVVFSVDPNYSVYNIQPNLHLRSAGTLKKLPTGEQYLIKNVHIDYKEYGIKCDTAIVNQTRTETRFFGNILMWDTIRTITANRAELFKENNKNRIFLYDNVKIDQDSIRIYGKSAQFLQQFNNATVQNDVRLEYTQYPTVLKSKHLIYDMPKKDIFASMVESVTAMDSIYRYYLTTSSVNYNDSSQILKLNNQFSIRSKQLAKKIQDFTYLKKNNFNLLFEKPEINSPDAIILSGLKGEYNLRDGKAWIWDKINVTSIENNGKDTTILYADTAYYDLKNRRLDLFSNVKIFRDSLKANCGLAIFYQNDNKIKLLNNPEMYFGKSYVRGDSVDVFLSKDSVSTSIDKAVVMGNGFMERPAETALETEKNNLKGRQIELFFKNKQLDMVKAFGQVTSLFYIKNEHKKPTEDSVTIKRTSALKEADGANQVTGDTLVVLLKDGKVEQVVFKGGCEGTYYPGKFKKLIKK